MLVQVSFGQTFDRTNVLGQMLIGQMLLVQVLFVQTFDRTKVVSTSVVWTNV